MPSLDNTFIRIVVLSVSRREKDAICINHGQVILPPPLDLFNTGDTILLYQPGRESNGASCTCYTISESTIVFCVPAPICSDGKATVSRGAQLVGISDLSAPGLLSGDHLVHIAGHVLHVQGNSPVNGRDRFGVRVADGISITTSP